MVCITITRSVEGVYKSTLRYKWHPKHKTYTATCLLFLKTTLKARHTTANVIPAVARNKYTTVKANDTVTTSSIGIPSSGTPSAQLYVYYVYISMHRE